MVKRFLSTLRGTEKNALMSDMSYHKENKTNMGLYYLLGATVCNSFHSVSLIR